MTTQGLTIPAPRRAQSTRSVEALGSHGCAVTRSLRREATLLVLLGSVAIVGGAGVLALVGGQLLGF